MKCNDNCIEINALPKCLTDDGQLILTNLTFPDSPSQDILVMLHNVSSNASISFTITTDADGNIIESDGVESVGLDLTEAYDLMNHVYKIEFLDKLTLQPVTVSICGEEACCLTFGVLPLTSSGEVPATTGKCGEPCDVVPPTPPVIDCYKVIMNGFIDPTVQDISGFTLFSPVDLFDPNAKDNLEYWYVQNGILGVTVTIDFDPDSQDYTITLDGLTIQQTYYDVSLNPYVATPC